MQFNSIFTWGNNPVRAELKGKPCRVIARGKMNSVLIVFEDGRKVVTSRYAIRPRHMDNE